VTDNPAYPEEVERSVATAAAIARMPGHRVSTVYINSQCIADLEVERFLQHGVGIENRADAHRGAAQLGDAPLQRLDPLPQRR